MVEAAEQLRKLAENLKQHHAEGQLLKWSLDLRYWHPEWEKPTKKDVA